MDRELSTEIVKSGTWLYDNAIPHEVWIVKQNFEYHYEEGYEDGPEQLNADGEAYQVVYSRDGRVSALGPARLSLEEAIAAAEAITSTITWTNHILQRLYGGRWYSKTAV